MFPLLFFPQMLPYLIKGAILLPVLIPGILYLADYCGQTTFYIGVCVSFIFIFICFLLTLAETTCHCAR